jgi:NADP-dependent 3-hydroxy acid dehydrogenase YdfG
MPDGDSIEGARALVTGASQGIGRAIAEALLDRGAQTMLVARSGAALDEIRSPGAAPFPADLTDHDAPRRIAEETNRRWGGLDILVHAVGVHHVGAMSESSLDDLDRLYQVNLRTPYALTRALLPLLTAASGQIVFINSSITRAANLARRGQYAAMAHALRAVADSLRDEVNSASVRVMTVYPGATATGLQEAIHRANDKRYQPERLLQASDVARTVCDALSLARTAEVTDLYVRPMMKS